MTSISEGYSADIDIYLLVNGRRLPASQVGPDSMILCEPHELPPETAAQVVIVIDGREKVHDVFLCHGLSGGSRCVEFF